MMESIDAYVRGSNVNCGAVYELVIKVIVFFVDGFFHVLPSMKKWEIFRSLCCH
jgi:hypothetical protein